MIVAPCVYLLLTLVRIRGYLTNSKSIVGIFGLLVITFFNKLLFKGQTLGQQDFNNLQITFFDLFQKSLFLHKSPPIWNSYTGGGFDAFSNPLSVYFSPFLPVFIFVKDVFFAANIFIILQVFFTLIFAFTYFRVINLSKGASILGTVMIVFNGFLTMRLSPGVGLEYFFSLKWLLLALAFTHLYFEGKKTKDLLFLGISLGFLFEGNMNMALSAGFFWLLYTLFLFGIKDKKIFLSPIIGSLIYSIKLVPGFYMIMTAEGRISEVASGWRTGKINPFTFPTYIFPYKHLFYTPAFTPGAIGALLFITALIYLFLFRNKLKFSKKHVFVSVALLTIGSLLVTYNPLSEVFFKLPIFNRMTIIPAFIVFLFVPVSIICAIFVEELARKGRKIAYILFVLPFLIYAEVLIGPSIFGIKSYSFNFLKMDYKSEMQKLDYYDFLKGTNKVAMFTDDMRLLTLPSYNSYFAVYTLNDFKYLYGSNNIDDLASRENLVEISKYADIFIATREMRTGTKKLAEFEVKRFDDKNYDNFAIIDRSMDYDKLQLFRWDYKLKIYEPLQKEITSVKKNNSHPFKHSFVVQKNNFEKDGSVITSITYSPFWKTDSSLLITKGTYEYLKIKNARIGQTITLTYINPFIYLGFFMSLVTFSYIIYKLRKYEV
jgi:hypothetical protein